MNSGQTPNFSEIAPLPRKIETLRAQLRLQIAEYDALTKKLETSVQAHDIDQMFGLEASIRLYDEKVQRMARQIEHMESKVRSLIGTERQEAVNFLRKLTENGTLAAKENPELARAIELLWNAEECQTPESLNAALSDTHQALALLSKAASEKISAALAYHKDQIRRIK